LIKVCALRCRLAAYPLNRRANGLQQSHGALSSVRTAFFCVTNSLLGGAARRAFGPADSV
jgi:hypothetical protein